MRGSPQGEPIIDELRRRRPGWNLRLIYTGSPNDGNLPATALEELCMQGPDLCLDVMRGESLGETVAIMQALQQEFSSSPPDAVMPVGSGSEFSPLSRSRGVLTRLRFC